jgi:hypothetical protein
MVATTSRIAAVKHRQSNAGIDSVATNRDAYLQPASLQIDSNPLLGTQ